MSLKEELGLVTNFKLYEHESMLNLYHTAAMLRKRATEFFSKYHLTDVQFNVLDLLFYQGGEKGGLTQIELSRMMLVNRSNITSLIDRMEKAGLVIRTNISEDRRYNIIKLTQKGKDKLKEISSDYTKKVRQIMSVLEPDEKKMLVDICERLRSNLNQMEA
ncbi:MAG: MarR family transcriptional regulator [Spirochaetes bacterium]|nr:MarR family transcriptional regulator [Spirochaetota bacterium]